MHIGRDDRRQPPGPAIVALEAGGDHQFDLGHLRRQGAVRLILLLLERAGYRKPVPWRVRIEKKIVCGGETRSVTVVGAKPWCCYLKVKPGDNDTGHFCSLLMPDGYRGETVYEALKDAEDEVNRAWRGGDKEATPVDDTERPGTGETARQAAAREAADQLFGPPAEADVAPAPAEPVLAEPALAEPVLAEPVPAEPVPAAEEESGNEATTSELLGWTRDADKVRLTLLAIHELGLEGKATAIDEFVTALADKLSWQGLRRKQVGAILSTLARRGYLSKLMRGSVPLGDALTAEGREVIQDLLPPGETAPPPAVGRPSAAAPTTDPARLVAALTGIAQGYTNAYQKLQENRARRA